MLDFSWDWDNDVLEIYQYWNDKISGEADDVVILDANHFLAGKELVFDIELVSIGE